MSQGNNYIEKTLQKVSEKNTGQIEFITVVNNVLGSLENVFAEHPEFIEENILERLVEPERIIEFRVPWMDDEGKTQVNRGYRVQFSSALGPYKGGMRFHPSVNQSIMKSLAFEQTFKNSLTGQFIGSGKGGSDFDPKGKSDAEVMRFCQSFMNELYRHIGSEEDIPAGDIGVGAREIGYLYGQYKRLNHFEPGVLTGKPINLAGSVGRTEATGYGLVYFTQQMLNDQNDTLDQKTAVVSGSGNVAIFAIEKLQELGTKIIACSDSSGYVVDPSGINLDVVKEIKLEKRGRIKEYIDQVEGAVYQEGSMWDSLDESFDLAFPCATQGEIDTEGAKNIISQGAFIVAEGANMPCDAEAVQLFKDNNVLYAPGKAANAGGAVVSGFEMSQNAQKEVWTFEQVDEKLQESMTHIYETVKETSVQYNVEGSLLKGANIAGFLRVAEAMIRQGVV